MQNNTVVVFTKNNAVILRNPPDIESYRSMHNVVVNPNFDEVSGIPPHLWKKDGDRIIPHTPSDQDHIMADINKHGSHNVVAYPVIKTVIQDKIVQVPVLYLSAKIYMAIATLGVAILTYLMFHK